MTVEDLGAVAGGHRHSTHRGSRESDATVWTCAATARAACSCPRSPSEHGFDHKRVLAATCRKAGLPANAWHDDETVDPRGFEAEVFGDEAPSQTP